MEYSQSEWCKSFTRTSRERKLQGAYTTKNENSNSLWGANVPVWKFQGAKFPGSELAMVLLELSLQGANWPGRDEKARYSPGPSGLYKN